MGKEIFGISNTLYFIGIVCSWSVSGVFVRNTFSLKSSQRKACYYLAEAFHRYDDIKKTFHIISSQIASEQLWQWNNLTLELINLYDFTEHLYFTEELRFYRMHLMVNLTFDYFTLIFIKSIDILKVRLIYVFRLKHTSSI